MSQFLKPKNYQFAKNFDDSISRYKRSSYQSRQSTQRNIARLNFSFENDWCDTISTKRNLSLLSNIGVGVVVKRKLPESSLCDIIDLSSVTNSKKKTMMSKRGLIDTFYARRKTSMKSLTIKKNQSMGGFPTNDLENLTETLDTNLFLKSSNFAAMISKPAEKTAINWLRSNKKRSGLTQRPRADTRNCISVQTEDYIIITNQ